MDEITATGDRNVVGGLWTWFVVVVAGVLVLGLVSGLGLFSRLEAGQEVIDGLKPAFSDGRVAGDVGAISMVSAIVDMADPVTTAEGGAAAEVPALVDFVSAGTGLSGEEVLAALSAEVPHLTGLLMAVPLEEVSAEIPQLVGLLSEVLGVSEGEVVAALETNFPALKQSIDALPVVTGGWNDVASEFADVGPLTRFDGSDVVSVTDVRDYFAVDVIGAVASQESNFQKLESTWPPVDLIPVILVAIGVVVLVYGLLLTFLARKGEIAGRQGTWAWSVVVGAGVLVLVLVGVLQLYPRLEAGQDVLDGARPIYGDGRVAGDVGAISMVSAIVDMADPVTTAEGGAAAEVPALVDFVSAGTGLSGEEVLAALSAEVPHLTGLLMAVPLEEVSAEIPQLVGLLSEVLGVSEGEVVAALETNFPALKQSIDALPVVTGGWNDVASEFADVGPLTRFDGSDVVSVTDVRDYFAVDVIGAVASQESNFAELDGTEPRLDWYPFLLTVLGLIVVVYGAAMTIISRRPLVSGVGELSV